MANITIKMAKLFKTIYAKNTTKDSVKGQERQVKAENTTKCRFISAKDEE